MGGGRPVGTFLEECRRNFRQTGAVVPSSRALARAITAHLVPGDAPRRILEAGAGTGVFTEEIARRMGPGDVLDVYEVNPVFADHVEARLRSEPVFLAVAGRVALHRRDVLDVPPGGAYDRIVCGLPFNNFDPECVRALMDTFMSRLTPGGVFSYFEYALLRTLKQLVAPRAERERLRSVGAVTSEFIRRYQVRSDPVLLNVPPAVARHLVKPVSVTLPAAKQARPLAPAAALR
jgi:phospholipid N-methyltransferase